MSSSWLVVGLMKRQWRRPKPWSLMSTHSTRPWPLVVAVRTVGKWLVGIVRPVLVTTVAAAVVEIVVWSCVVVVVGPIVAVVAVVVRVLMSEVA